MARYRVTVFERIVHEYQYEIEADSADEAKRNALDGCFEQRVVHAGRSRRHRTAARGLGWRTGVGGRRR